MFNEIYIEDNSNCLFKWLSREVYGTEVNLYFVRQVVSDYIEANIDHFYDFITIDPSKYISNMRRMEYEKAIKRFKASAIMYREASLYTDILQIQSCIISLNIQIFAILYDAVYQYTCIQAKLVLWRQVAL